MSRIALTPPAPALTLTTGNTSSNPISLSYSGVLAPDTVASRVTGDIDIRAKMALVGPVSAFNSIFSKRDGVDEANSCYVFGLDVDLLGRCVLLLLTSNGTTFRIIESTDYIPYIAGGNNPDLWVRATMDADNGAGASVHRFYTSTDGVAWTPLGTAVNTAGAVTIRAGTDTLEIGAQISSTFSPFKGKIYYVEVRDGIDGPVVVKFDPPLGPVRSFVSSTGETWTLYGSARLVTGGSVESPGPLTAAQAAGGAEASSGPRQRGGVPASILQMDKPYWPYNGRRWPNT